MKHFTLPSSTLDPILVDPGKFYMSIMLRLYETGIPIQALNLACFYEINTLIDSACSVEDKPKDYTVFLAQLANYSMNTIKEMESNGER